MRKIRSEEVWAQVRAAWEAGETARAVARRYDVGVPALWKRREAEGWVRPDPKAGPVEPAEGWDSYAHRKLNEFETRLEEVRELAADLVAAMRGEPLDDVAFFVARGRRPFGTSRSDAGCVASQLHLPLAGRASGGAGGGGGL